MPLVSLGSYEVNGVSHRHVPGVAGLGTTGNDGIWISTDYPDSEIIAYQTVMGLEGNDTMTGFPANLFGGDGNDVFWSMGLEFAQPGAPLPVVRGGAGNDTFNDLYGGCIYYGGAGSDFFTNGSPITHSYEGDHDEAYLGSGNDKASLNLFSASYSTPDPVFGYPVGEGPERRTYVVDGGSGIDTLQLFSVSVVNCITGQPNGRLNFNRLAEGHMQFFGADVTGFERFDLNVMTVGVSQIILGDQADRLIFQGTLESWILNMNNDISQIGRIKVPIFGGGGNDLIVGCRDFMSEHIYGGAGNDVLISGGAYDGTMDSLFGGLGDDVLVGGGAFGSSMNHSRSRGGAGADLFILSLAGGDNIADFTHGEDKIVFSMGRFWHYSYDHTRQDFVAAIRPGSRFYEVSSTADELVFSLQSHAPSPIYATDIFTYHRDTGEITRDNGYSGGDNMHLAWVFGAPHLRLADFGLLP